MKDSLKLFNPYYMKPIVFEFTKSSKIYLIQKIKKRIIILLPFQGFGL